MTHCRSPLRVLVAEDSAFGAALLGAVDSAEDLECVGRVRSLAELVPAATACQPDVVVLAYLLGGSTSLPSIAELRACVPGVQVLVLCEVMSDILARESLRRGADGFLVHSGEVEPLLERVRACAGRPPAGAVPLAAVAI